MYVMLRDDITAEQSAALKGRIEKHEGVREVKYTSKDEAAASFRPIWATISSAFCRKIRFRTCMR